MAIRARHITNFDALDDIDTFLGNLKKVVIKIAGEEAATKPLAGAKAELGQQPGPTGTPERKIEWTTRRQQNAYFASNGFGAGIPYKRSGGLAAAWITKTESTNDWFKFRIYNPLPSARFVYGSLALSDVSRAARFQQRFHKITGWPLAVIIVLKWMEVYEENLIDSLNDIIDDIGTTRFKRRGITPRLPKKKGKRT